MGEPRTEEREGEFLWAPTATKNGRRALFHWRNMTRVMPGDTIFSYVKGRIVAVATARQRAVSSPRPFLSAAGSSWQRDGWRLGVEYRDLDQPLTVRDILSELQPLLPSGEAPLTRAGGGVQGYLFALPDAAGELLLAKIGGARSTLGGYLLTWNPASWTWSDRSRLTASVLSGEAPEIEWSCGTRRSMSIGERVFLLQLGDGPRGIVATGRVVREPTRGAHWNAERAAAGGEAWFVRWELDGIADAPLPSGTLIDPALSALNWSPRASGTALTGEQVAALDAAFLNHLLASSVSPEETTDEFGALEGEQRERRIVERRREARLRRRKIEDALAKNGGRLRCEVPGCGFDFFATYGALGRGYAHVHHLNMLGASTAPVTTVLSDLAIVCANCHAMIHRGGANRPLESLIDASHAIS